MFSGLVQRLEAENKGKGRHFYAATPFRILEYVENVGEYQWNIEMAPTDCKYLTSRASNNPRRLGFLAVVRHSSSVAMREQNLPHA